jgi:hypothetical protein
MNLNALKKALTFAIFFMCFTLIYKFITVGTVSQSNLKSSLIGGLAGGLTIFIYNYIKSTKK